MDITELGIPSDHYFNQAVEHCKEHSPHISYQDKCTLAALHSKATTHSLLPPPDHVLLFDVEREDWLQEWDKLGEVSPSEAMRAFTATLSYKSDQFTQWVDAQRRTNQSESKPEMMDSHITRPSHIRIPELPPNSLPPTPLSVDDVTKQIGSAEGSGLPEQPIGSESESELCTSSVAAGFLWCKRSQAVEFIDSVKDDPDARVVIAPGESITVKVPVQPPLSTLFWEYVTERHDIGFGVELEVPTENPQTPTHNSASNLIEIIPKERRNSCEDVIVGCHRVSSHTELHSHRIYHLRFDNKYSLFTRKVLYYRVFCRASTPLQ